MNNKVSKALRSLSYIALAVLALGATSCSKSEPVSPHNETEHKHHEEPNRVEIVLTEVTLPSSLPFDYAHLGDIAEVSPKNTQTFVWKQQSDGTWAAGTANSTGFVVKTLADNPSAVYRLELKYYAPDGDLMNDEFVEEGEDVKHQHFFAYYPNANGQRITDATAIPYEYVYADVNESGVLLPKNNPIGLKGYIRFKEIKSSVNLKIELLHAKVNKYIPGTTVHPFYFPGAELLSQSEMEVVIPLTFTK